MLAAKLEKGAEKAAEEKAAEEKAKATRRPQDREEAGLVLAP